MLVRVEAVVRGPAGLRVRVHSDVGTAVALWRGAPEDVPFTVQKIADIASWQLRPGRKP
ncbi:hypothetical protein ACWD6R_36960 [Streptomyces sp. NPDC005151]